ncbi:hypothetical protein K438DRAFT_1978786 [Mycena galopus ATCC 62051]|nr:hypothetical protein K438DRAFT_1978786 [Mycena galopus ATCC 62051]
MGQPDDDLLYSWLWFAKEKEGEATAATFYKRIKSVKPEWSRAIHRIRRLLQRPAPNCIVIFAYSCPPKARDDLEAALCLTYVRNVASPDALVAFATILGDSPVKSIGAIYDSSPDSIDWYYEVFGPIEGGGFPHNMIASDIFGKPIKGDVLLTVTTPGQTEAAQHPMVGREIVKTLWHYLVMKVDVGRLARERALERMLTM